MTTYFNKQLDPNKMKDIFEEKAQCTMNHNRLVTNKIQVEKKNAVAGPITIEINPED